MVEFGMLSVLSWNARNIKAREPEARKVGGLHSAVPEHGPSPPRRVLWGEGSPGPIAFLYLCFMLDREAIVKELVYQASRSSGPGGQHVNRTESKVELHWNLEESDAVTNEQKTVLRNKLSARLTNKGVLIMSSQATRSQLKNREIVTRRFLDLIEKLIIPSKPRILTKPGKNAIEKRLKEKRLRAEKKSRRGSADKEF